AEFTIGEGELMAHDVPLGCAPDEYDDLISGTCSHLPFISHILPGFIAILKGKKMPSPRFGSHLWQCLCTLSGKSLRTVSCPALIF
ncbi:hypothetical protein ACWJQ9_22355, partial [Klebsiella pneumoniae]